MYVSYLLEVDMHGGEPQHEFIECKAIEEDQMNVNYVNE